MSTESPVAVAPFSDLILDTDFVRSHFPALDTPWALFDNAGGTPVPRQLIERVTAYMSRYQVQLGASYPLSVEAGEAVAAGHRVVEEWMGAGEGEVFLGPSTTRNLDLLARSLRQTWDAGDAVVVSDLDHEANIGCWRQLESTGIELRTWKLRAESADLLPEDLDPLLADGKVRLVACTHCSNIVGRIHDIAAIARQVHEAGALLCVDGVGYAPHRHLDMAALGADFYAFSLYKAFGPHVGAMWGRRELLAAAGQANHFFVGNEDLAYKFEPGGVTHELVAALPGIFNYFDALDRHHGGDPSSPRRERLERVFDRIARHEERLAAPLIDYLLARDDVRILGPATADAAQRLPIVAFTVEGRKASTVPAVLDQHQLAVRWGHFYAYRGAEALGILDADGAVRVSMAHTNTEDEVARLIEALDRVL